MQPINYRRLLLGAALAAVVFVGGEIAVIGTFGPRLMAAREAAHMPTVAPNAGLGVLELGTMSLLLSWLYVAIRPRFGPGVTTALRSGFALWVALGFVSTIHMMSDNFGFPNSLLAMVGGAMLPVVLAASIAAAWAYRE